MSMTEPHLEGQQPPADGPTPAQLREAAERGRQASRENAFLRAGIDVDSPAGQMFMASYQGDLDREKIQDGWQAIASQFAPPPESPQPPVPQQQPQGEQPPPQATAEELERQRMMSDISTGTLPPDQQIPPDPVMEGYAAFQSSMQSGQTREEASAHLTQRLVDAAVKGDERAIWSGWTDEQLSAARSADGVIHG